MLQHDDGTATAVLHPHHHGHSEGAANLPHLRIPAGDRAIAKGMIMLLSFPDVIYNVKGALNTL